MARDTGARNCFLIVEVFFRNIQARKEHSKNSYYAAIIRTYCLILIGTR
jgi:3-dehydroquinate dehydratase